MNYRVSAQQLSEFALVSTRAARRYMKANHTPAGPDEFIMSLNDMAAARQKLKAQRNVIVTGVMLQHGGKRRHRAVRMPAK